MGHISGTNSGNLDLKKRINELEAEVEKLNSNNGNYDNKIQVTGLQAGNSYKAPSSGYLLVQCVKDNDAAASEYRLKIGDLYVLRYKIDTGSLVYISYTIPMSKDDVVTCDMSENMYQLDRLVWFIPQ